MLIQNLVDTSANYIERVQTYTGAFITNYDPVTASYMAKGIINRLLLQQATLCAFIDAFRVFAVAAIAIIPLLLLLKNIKKEEQ